MGRGFVPYLGQHQSLQLWRFSSPLESPKIRFSQPGRGKKNKKGEADKMKWNVLYKEQGSTADLWDVSSGGGDCGATARLRGNSLGHRCAIFVIWHIVCHLRKRPKKKKGRVNNYSFLYRDCELSAASCWLWSPWPVQPRLASSTELISPLHANWLPIAETGLDWAGPGAPYLWRLIDEGLGWDDRDLCGGDATG